MFALHHGATHTGSFCLICFIMTSLFILSFLNNYTYRSGFSRKFCDLLVAGKSQQWEKCFLVFNSSLLLILTNSILTQHRNKKGNCNTEIKTRQLQFFFNLQLRTALKTYRVPWDISPGIHPIITLLSSKSKLVTQIYTKLISIGNKPLPVLHDWEHFLQSLDLGYDWHTIWTNIFSSSKNLAHQLIHFKFIHKFYFTPDRRFKLKLADNDSCPNCLNPVRGDYLHMFWYCPAIKSLWEYINSIVSDIIGKYFPTSPAIYLFCFNPNVHISYQEKRILMALTATKKVK